jgi:hypothetical protein
MRYQPPSTLLWYNVFLSALLAKVALHKCTAIQAILFFPFGIMAHLKFFLKIGTKKSVYRLLMVHNKSILYF